ncbi:MAG: threonine/serine exporter ThrE family protein [Acidimicrobiales bacterium]
MSTDEAAGSSAEHLPLLREFVVRLGSAMTVAGDSVDSINDRLRRVVDAYGFPEFDFFVLPTGMLVESGDAATSTVLLSTHEERKRYRFDQIAELYHLLGQAEEAAITPADGLLELARIEMMEPGFGPVVRVFGHGVLTAGLALLLQPTLGGMAVAFALGLLVGLLKLPRLATLDLIFPVIAAFIVAATVFAISHTGGVGDNPVRVLIPPLATFLPGGVLTIATVELAAGQMISGASRLVSGMVQLGLLAFGIVAAASLIGVDQHVLIDNPVDRLGPWAPWVGVLIVALGDYLHFSAPARSLGWILVVLYVAYAGQAVGGALFGGALSGFFGGLAMTPVVLWIDDRPYGAPSLVTFLPAFWLLVPGAVGLIGVTEIIGADQSLGAEDVATALTSIASIALGVLLGSASYHTATAGVRRVAQTLPPISVPKAARVWPRRRPRPPHQT